MYVANIKSGPAEHLGRWPKRDKRAEARQEGRRATDAEPSRRL
jgi:hypothetical protein